MRMTDMAVVDYDLPSHILPQSQDTLDPPNQEDANFKRILTGVTKLCLQTLIHSSTI
jgi:hypothetical protein